MGNNDSLPPPPPPGLPGQPGQPLQPPHVPLSPPPLPPQAAALAAPTPPIQPAPSKKSKLPLIIVGAVVVAGLAVGGVLLFGKNDDKTTETLGGDTPSTVAASDTTSGPDVTFVITSPQNSEPALTTLLPSATTVGAVPDATITDDTNLFKVTLPGTFKTDTAPIDAGGTKVAQVSGSEDLASYNNGHDTPGITVLGGPADQLQAPADLVKLFDPGASECTDRNAQSNVATTFGAAEVLFIDGCGANKASKVVMAVLEPTSSTVFVVISQGPGPATGNLLQFTQAVLESITPA